MQLMNFVKIADLLEAAYSAQAKIRNHGTETSEKKNPTLLAQLLA
jgi:hypothetical protein